MRSSQLSTQGFVTLPKFEAGFIAAVNGDASGDDDDSGYSDNDEGGAEHGDDDADAAVAGRSQPTRSRSDIHTDEEVDAAAAIAVGKEQPHGGEGNVLSLCHAQ